MNAHTFIPPNGEWAPTHPEERCAYTFTEEIKLEGGGRYKVTTPCLKTVQKHQP